MDSLVFPVAGVYLGEGLVGILVLLLIVLVILKVADRL